MSAAMSGSSAVISAEPMETPFTNVDRVVELVRALGFPPGTRVQHGGGDVSVTTP